MTGPTRETGHPACPLGVHRSGCASHEGASMHEDRAPWWRPVPSWPPDQMS